MLKYVATALTALVVLGACSPSDPPSSTSPANGTEPAPAPGHATNDALPSQVSGTISLRVPAAVNPGAKLIVQLVDVAQPELIIAESLTDVSTQPPYSFSLPLEAGRIDKSRVYVVNVKLVDGERQYLPALQSPVLTGGAGSTIEVVLTSEATPGEDLKEAFIKLKSQIGGMRRIQDSFLDGDLSVAWDGFVEAGNKLRFMRVNSEVGEGDTAVRNNVEYAFLEGKPMAILKKGQGNTRVGWNEAGEVILNERGNGEPLSPEEAQAYYDDALKAFAMGERKLPSRK